LSRGSLLARSDTDHHRGAHGLAHIDVSGTEWGRSMQLRCNKPPTQNYKLLFATQFNIAGVWAVKAIFSLAALINVHEQGSGTPAVLQGATYIPSSISDRARCACGLLCALPPPPNCSTRPAPRHLRAEPSLSLPERHQPLCLSLPLSPHHPPFSSFCSQLALPQAGVRLEPRSTSVDHG
jgi:hypothetical protein